MVSLRDFVASVHISGWKANLTVYGTQKSRLVRVRGTEAMRALATVCNVVTAVLLPLAFPLAVLGQEAAATSVNQIDEIIVTAEKWEQSAATVGMPIIAATGDV